MDFFLSQRARTPLVALCVNVMNSSSHDFTIIWLDASNAQPDTFFNRPSSLASIISDLHPFTNLSDCLQYIASIQPGTLVFLVVSGQLGEHTLPDLQNVSRICHIYIYCTNREGPETWANNAHKVRGVYVDRSILLNQLTADVALYSKELSAPISLFKRDDLNRKERSSQNLSKESAKFMWFQLLLETLLQSKQTTRIRDEMLNECRKECQENAPETSKIDEFEATYTANQAIRWYTRDSFLFRLVNRAMRTQDIDSIYTYRSFILDLHQQLSELSTTTSSNISAVYRGQMMTFEELEQIRANMNGLISINTYFSTSIHSEVAFDFCGGGLGRPHLESIMFTIKIRPNTTEKPFAKIHEYSYMSHEGEVLFSAGTIFRIVDVSEFSDGIWSVELELSNDVQEQWHDVMVYLRSEMSGRPTLATLGNFLAEMGDLDKSERYYRLLMNELENEEDTGAILIGIAAVHFRKSDYPRALDYCSQGLEQLTTLAYIHPDLATAYNLMGMIHLEMDQLDDATHYFEHALTVHEKILPNDDPLIAADLHNMASVDIKAHRFEAALSKLQRSLEIKLVVLPPDHPLIGHTYVSMGLLYAKQRKWSDSHYFYDKAIELQQNTLPAIHTDLAISYANKARALTEEKRFDSALALYKQALDIQLKKIPLNSDHLSNIYEHLGLIYIHTMKYTHAIRSFEKALQYKLNCNASWDQLCQLRNNMGTAHYRNGSLVLALKEYEIAFDLIPSCDHSSNRFSTLNNIATAHLRIENYPVARHFYEQLMEALQHVAEPPSNISLLSVHENIGLCYFATQENDSALEQFARVLSLTEDASILSRTHSHIADAFLSENEFAKAIENYELALSYDSLNEHLVIVTHNSIGTVHYLSGNIQRALDSYRQALDIQLARQSDDSSELAATYSNLARAYCQGGDLIEAMNYYVKQLQLETDLDVQRNIVDAIESIRLSL